MKNVIVYRTKASQAPARRNAARMKKQRAFDRAFPAVGESDLADGHCVTPVVAAGVYTRHRIASNERKLALLIDYSAER